MTVPPRDNPMKQTIALVDDDRNILTSVQMTLEQEGFQVRTYTDGESALQGMNARPGGPRGARYQDALDGRHGAAPETAAAQFHAGDLPHLEGRGSGRTDGPRLSADD